MKYGATDKCNDRTRIANNWKGNAQHNVTCRDRIMKRMFEEGDADGRVQRATEKELQEQAQGDAKEDPLFSLRNKEGNAQRKGEVGSHSCSERSISPNREEEGPFRGNISLMKCARVTKKGAPRNLRRCASREKEVGSARGQDDR